MLKEIIWFMLLIGLSKAIKPTFTMVEANAGGRRLPFAEIISDSADDGDDSNVDLHRAESAQQYRHYVGPGYDRTGGLDPQIIRAARLHAYKSALLHSIQAEEDLVLDNQQGLRFGLNKNNGGGGSRTGRRVPQGQRNVYGAGGQYRRPPSQPSRAYRGHRSAGPSSRELDDDEDDEYY